MLSNDARPRRIKARGGQNSKRSALYPTSAAPRNILAIVSSSVHGMAAQARELRFPGPAMDPGRALPLAPLGGSARFGCCWVENDDGPPWRYCDAPVSAPGSAWCSMHRAIVYHRAGSSL